MDIHAALVPLINATLLTDSFFRDHLPKFQENLSLPTRHRLQDFLSGKCLLQMMRVPHESIGRIIGKGGEQIAKITRLTGCIVEIGLLNELEISRPVFLLGDLPSIDAAKAMLAEIIVNVMLSVNHAPDITKVITIPGCHTGKIIGKNGKTLRSLQLRTNTKITMIQCPGENEYFDKKMVLVGNSKDVCQTEMLIRDMLEVADKKILNKVFSPSSEKRQNQIISQRGHFNTANDSSTDNESMDEDQADVVPQWKLNTTTSVNKTKEKCVFEVVFEKSKDADASKEDMKLDLDYSTLKDFIKQLEETHQKKMEKVEEFYEEKIRVLTYQQQKMLEELKMAKEKQVVNGSTGMDVLLQYLAHAYQRSILQSFLSDSENISKFKDGSNLHPETLRNFQDLSESGKGLIVIGIAMVGTVVGLTSWKFIFWAWPTLMSFVSAVELNNSAIVVEWVKSFVKTPGYENFIQSWMAGQSITDENILALGPEILQFGFTHLAPSLFMQTENGFAFN